MEKRSDFHTKWRNFPELFDLPEEIAASNVASVCFFALRFGFFLLAASLVCSERPELTAAAEATAFWAARLNVGLKNAAPTENACRRQLLCLGGGYSLRRHQAAKQRLASGDAWIAGAV